MNILKVLETYEELIYLNDLDVLVMEKLVDLRKRAIDSLLEKHPHIFSALNKFFAKDENSAGLQVTENGKLIGEYTFILDGLYIKEVKAGELSAELNLPFMKIKPYGIIEKSVLERMLQDEQEVIEKPFTTMKKYMPDVTIKFLR
ncbi:hypothetical protein GGQ84_002938 [Desulfitispora alkaliphila]|uniref:hypothetical protein n=1 Tax=Desulfitispora alkaliphila TaxID=622674 RepID=UPI003D219A96